MTADLAATILQVPPTEFGGHHTHPRAILPVLKVNVTVNEFDVGVLISKCLPELISFTPHKNSFYQAKLSKKEKQLSDPNVLKLK